MCAALVAGLERILELFGYSVQRAEDQRHHVQPPAAEQ
jgi:hypothetical protein